MAVEILTKDDLANFKRELLAELKHVIHSDPAHAVPKWLRSPEVRKLLHISPGTLQHMRISGQLPYSKIGSVFYYPYDEILKILETNLRNRE